MTEAKAHAYKIVFDDLCRVGLFVGKYDAVHGDEHFMYGINTVMEFVAHGVSDECLDEFSDRFNVNMLKSQEAVAGTDPEVVE
jgi:hypothetical protein